jgi:hypothetical protein
MMKRNKKIAAMRIMIPSKQLTPRHALMWQMEASRCHMPEESLDCVLLHNLNGIESRPGKDGEKGR